MTLVVIFLVNAALSFALSLLLASLLGPDGFGRYAIGLAATLVVNTALFEWLRLSTTRFYSERVRTERPEIRATLDRAYLGSSALLTLLTALAVFGGFEIGASPFLLLAAAACGLTYGLCEYRMAQARARFLEGPYALLCLLRAALGFALAAGAAYWWGNPALVLAGAALSALIPILVVLRRLADPIPASPALPVLKTFARYALPLIAASALYQLLPLLNRTILANREGFTEAGYFSLASELATRLFQNLGAALDLALFQLAIRAEELHGREAANRQVMANATLVFAIVAPSAAGLWAIWPSFERLFIPVAFHGHLSGTAGLIIPALAAFALVQYALNPVFQLRHRTAPVVAAAAVAVAVDLAIVLLWPGLSGPAGFAAAQLCGLGAGFVTLGALAVLAGARLPWRDLAATAVSSTVMLACLWPVRLAGSPLATLVGQVALGCLVYGALAVAFDIAGIRGHAARLIPRRARPQAQAK